MDEVESKESSEELKKYYKDLNDPEIGRTGKFQQELGSGTKILIPANYDNGATFGSITITGNPNYGKSVEAKKICVNTYHHPDFQYAKMRYGIEDKIIIFDNLLAEWNNSITKLNPDPKGIPKCIPPHRIHRIRNPALRITDMKLFERWRLLGMQPGRFLELMTTIATKGWKYHMNDPELMTELIEDIQQKRSLRPYPDINLATYSDATFDALSREWSNLRGYFHSPNDPLDIDKPIVRDWYQEIMHHYLKFGKRVFIIEMDLKKVVSKVIYNNFLDDIMHVERMRRLRPIIFLEEADYLAPKQLTGGMNEIPQIQSIKTASMKTKMRKPGVLIISITQYPSKLNQDLFTGSHYHLSGPLADPKDTELVTLPNQNFPKLAFDLSKGLRMFNITSYIDGTMRQYVPDISPCNPSQPRK